jgi:hypothetical protein
MPPLQGGRLVLVLVSLFFSAEMERGAYTVSCLGPTDEDSGTEYLSFVHKSRICSVCTTMHWPAFIKRCYARIFASGWMISNSFGESLAFTGLQRVVSTSCHCP